MSEVIKLPTDSIPAPEDFDDNGELTPMSENTYYDTRTGKYWIQNSRRDWIPISETALRRQLKARGICFKREQNKNVSQLDALLNALQLKKDVCWAGPLAGRKRDPLEVKGVSILVTTSPELIVPAPGHWPIIERILSGLFGPPEKDQRIVLHGWLQTALRALDKEELHPGQCLVFCGPKGCGKSLLQNQVITPLLGGRSAKPYRYMSGGTDFNGDLFGAEHLMVEDEVPSADLRARRAFGARIKEVVANETQSCHAKGRDAITLEPLWRITVSLNNEPENLMTLPPIDESLTDKIILLKASPATMPMPTDSVAERRAFRAAIAAELPAFVHFLLNEFSISDTWKSKRFGIREYHHPEIIEALTALAPETRLLELIDSVLFGNDSTPLIPWTGAARELEKKLRDSNAYAEAARLLSWPAACGVYLGRLEQKQPERFASSRVQGMRRWTIQQP